MAVRPIHMIARKILLFVGLCLALVASASELSQPVTQTDVQQLQQQIQVFDKELAVLKEVTSNRLDAQDKRVGDIGLWTGQQANYMATISNHSTLVGIGITVITIAVGFLAFISTRNRAITEAKAASASWFSEKSIELNKEIDILRKKALSAQKEVDDHVIETKLGINKIAADTTKNLSELVIKAAENIINQPNSAILSVGAIVEKPVVKNGQIVVGNTMMLSLACDHRTIDGATGAQFLQTLKQYIENPVTMLA